MRFAKRIEYIRKVEKMVRNAALIIAVSWLLLGTFTVVSANADNTKGHSPMIHYPQGKVSKKLCFSTFFL